MDLFLILASSRPPPMKDFLGIVIFFLFGLECLVNYGGDGLFPRDDLNFSIPVLVSWFFNAIGLFFFFLSKIHGLFKCVSCWFCFTPDFQLLRIQVEFFFPSSGPFGFIFPRFALNPHFFPPFFLRVHANRQKERLLPRPLAGSLTACQFIRYFWFVGGDLLFFLFCL